MLNFFTINKFY